MAWVLAGTVSGYDVKGTAYRLLGYLYYDNAQDIVNNRTLCYIQAYKMAGSPGGRIDYDNRGWGVSVAGSAGSSGSGSVGGVAQPRFDGMSPGDSAGMGSSSSFYINHAADGTGQVYAQASWDATSGGSYFDQGFSGSTYINLPKITRVPAAPSAFTVTRDSDTKQDLAWTRNATPIANYATHQVLRKQYSGGAWGAYSAIANLGASTTTGPDSYSDTSCVANRLYRYQIKATNPAGESFSAESLLVFTTPAAPATLVAEKLSPTSIRLDLTQAITHPYYKTRIEYTLNDGASWTLLTTLNTEVLTYTWNSVPGGSSVRFRARTEIDSSGNVGHGLTSSWKESNTVPLAAPPLAPSSLAPNGVAFNAAVAQLFTWQHNHSDSSPQSAYQLRYRLVGAPSWTTLSKTTSTASQRNISGGTFVNGNDYEWQVRTWGVHADPSDYSPTAVFTASAPPLVSLTGPANPLGAALATATWTYNDPEGSPQSGWEAELVQAGNVLEARSGSGSATSVAFTTRLDDATTYQARVRVKDGANLWSTWDQRSFTTSFPVPNVPTLTATWDPDEGAVVLVVDNPAGSPVVVENQFFRTTDNGITWELVDTAPNNGTGFDRTVVLGADVRYKVVAWSALPSSRESAEVPFNTDYIGLQYVGPSGGYWSAGSGFSQVLRMKQGLRKPPSIDLTTGAYDKVLHYYAGRRSAVETMGEAELRQGKVEFLVLTTAEMWLARQLALLPAPHLFRLPDGTKVFASVGPVSDHRVQEGAYVITFSITEVES